MKTQNSKMLLGPALLALLIGSNGCMTQSAIQYAKGHPEKAWRNNGFGYSDTDAKPNPNPRPYYYILLPLSAPADVVTAPFQLIDLGLWSMAAGSMRGGS